MHIEWVDGNQGRDRLGVGENVLSHGPRLDRRVIAGEPQGTVRPLCLGEACDTHQIIDVSSGVRIARNGRKYAKPGLAHDDKSPAGASSIDGADLSRTTHSHLQKA